jgi:hypothetical protein
MEMSHWKAVISVIAIAIWSMITANQWAKKGRGICVAALGTLLMFFGASVPPPAQTTEGVRDAQGRKGSEIDRSHDDDG